MNEDIAEIVASRRIKRSVLLRSAISAGAALMLGGKLARRLEAASRTESSLGFPEIAHGLTDTHQIPPGYRTQVFLRWGDPLLKNAPKFDPKRQTPEAQAGQFGCNHDFCVYMPRPRSSRSSRRGFLCINHEFTASHMMTPGFDTKTMAEKVTRRQVDIEIQAHGHSIADILRDGAVWRLMNSRYNRRITARTPIRLAGPAAGHARLKTSADPSGREVLGTLANCAGGTTPWGTVLIAEENFNEYFAGDPAGSSEAANHKRCGIPVKTPWYGWHRFYPRFNIEKEPHEPNRFGWMVEIDPYLPDRPPVKRTALGRFKHEAAQSAVSADGRVVLYMGDDERFEYLYKFVTKDRFQPRRRIRNRDLLDEGTLYAAKFEDSGTVRWLPLVHGQGALNASNGFRDQGDVLIETRRAADLAGATPLDRPEDVEVNPVTGRVYAAFSKNGKRRPAMLDAANPRAANLWGQILELRPPKTEKGVDHAALEHPWEMFIRAGDPRAGVGARYPNRPSKNGWLSNPDNLTFDKQGRIWITSDGMLDLNPPLAEGLYAADTAGPGRGRTRLFFNAPRGAEVSGPAFTPDNTTLFMSIQHPGTGPGANFDAPSTRWPDFDPAAPPRSAIVAVQK
ncbi:MAG: PhoX family phosphatase, partial [Elusimicrobiota bacterium]